MVQDIAEAFRRMKFADSIVEALDVLSLIKRALNMSYVSIIPDQSEHTPGLTCAASQQHLHSHGSLHELSSTYFDGNLRQISPITIVSRHESLPFVWRPRGGWSITPPSTPRGDNVMRLFDSFHILGGICIPIRLPNGILASVRFTTEDDVDLDGLLRQYGIGFAGIGLYVGSLLSKTYWPHGDIGTSMIELTEREMECLSLAAHGMADKSIARQLGISPVTARFHIQNAARKLSARNRTSAVVKAARMSLIPLPDDIRPH